MKIYISKMKFFAVTVLLALCAVAQATKSPAITLKDFYALNKEDSRIISGQSASRAQFPWQAAVTIDLGFGSAFCGGSLISPGWVLTAAHCVDGGISWTIKIGGLIRTGSEPGSIITSTTNGFHHEDYNSYLNNDIALIKLNEDLPLSDTIQPVKLPARSDVNDRLENMKLTVSGWGKTSDTGNVATNLQYVQLDTITNKKCAEVYGTGSIIESTLCCVGHPEHSTCNGDSGGPLVRYDDNGDAVQVGVVSFVHINGCASGNPSGYVRTASFLDWINEKTGIPIRD